MTKPTIVDEREMSLELDGAIRAALCLSFPADAAVFRQTRRWHGSGPSYSVILQEAPKGEVIAHVGVVDRRVRFGGAEARAAGIQNVLVVPAYRGKHFSDSVMLAAEVEAVRRGFDCGLLFCDPKLAGLYARMGWLPFVNDIVRIDDDGIEKPIPGKSIGMFLPIRWPRVPPGVIHLGGNDW